ncbi:hypothetical protein Pan97_26580 [Bremerella volcania]|uniref:Major Facilitator Superfamily protein n=1 Tax=Bremerella volcania TaxID=2527984 RepID=A0A518C8U6_9BACT|nr:DUF5690 family protein [Bremerella volcania]QDU75624.1 hypothetical protein Pan97_26580 [Bremerella volcania]
MYGFRKPFTVAEYDGTMVGSIDFKTIVVSIQVLGYMLSKFIGIKIISEMPPKRRAIALLGLILFAEAALALFGILPRPWNAIGLFFNGLCLGMVFGLVLGFLEGRRLTEALVAGLCTSFILADGVTKSVGAWLLANGVREDWMPFTAGLIFLLPLCVCVGMLTRIPAPSEQDIAARSARETMTPHDRWSLFSRYALGLSVLVGIYLLITIIRSIRADFAAELWGDLGQQAAPSIFTRSEMWVAMGVMFVNGLSIYVRNNRLAFFLSLGICALGFVIVAVALIGQQTQSMGAFQFMVLIGFGLYLPYVAIHTTVFERLLAMTRERGNLGFLMYLADAFGYLGYVVIMFSRNLFAGRENFLDFFTTVCWIALAASLLALFIASLYFANHGRQPATASAVAERV